MNETIKVRAADGLQVPLEGSPHEYINGQETVTVPDTAYYRRCIEYGDLVAVTEDTQPAKGSK